MKCKVPSLFIGTHPHPSGDPGWDRNVTSIMAWFMSLGKAGPGDTFLGVTELTHDPVLTEMFWSLGSGARLFVASAQAQRSGRLLVEHMTQERITVIQATPSIFDLTVNGGGWRGDPNVHVFSGGEAALPQLGPVCSKNCKSFTNVCGPTETTIWNTFHEVPRKWWHKDRKSVPIGKPLWNHAVLILDENVQPVPDGELGRLCLLGAGMTRGCLNLPEKMKKAFVPAAEP